MILTRKNIASNSKPDDLGHAVARNSIIANMQRVKIQLHDNESSNHRYILEMTHAEAQELADKIKSIYLLKGSVLILDENDPSQ